LALTTLTGCFEYKFHLAKGDSLVMYTDGLIETRRGEQFFGEERLKEVLLKYKRREAEQMADEALSATQNFSGGYFVDDVTLIVVKRK
jgi:serine phosphatase RsbU (regulator of sigma subunit)